MVDDDDEFELIELCLVHLEDELVITNKRDEVRYIEFSDVNDETDGRIVVCDDEVDELDEIDAIIEAEITIDEYESNLVWAELLVIILDDEDEPVLDVDELDDEVTDDIIDAQLHIIDDEVDDDVPVVPVELDVNEL